MGARFVRDERPTCRSQGVKCCWCGEPLVVGQSYLAVTWADPDHGIYTWRFHPECSRARIDSDPDDWVFGEFVRGSNQLRDEMFCD